MLFPDIAKSNPAHDTGGKVKLALKAGITGTAEWGGKNKEYRYRLTRTWDSAKPFALFVLMNPSIADENTDDRTIAKCCRLACAWGYGGIFVANTFAYRHTYQKRLIEEVSYLIGPDNDRHIVKMAKEAAIVVFAYGKPHARPCERVVKNSPVSSSKRPTSILISWTFARMARLSIRCTSRKT